MATSDETRCMSFSGSATGADLVLKQCGTGAGMIFQIPAGSGRERTKNLNPRRILVYTRTAARIRSTSWNWP